jgi:GMP synthase (glutamine-hydrolysing)
VGWVALEPLAAAAGDPLFTALPTGAAGLHFNEDGAVPPPGAVALLRPVDRDAEAFRIGACAWGMQFHPEVDEPALDGWYRDWPQAVVAAGVTEAEARAVDALHLSAQRALSGVLFGGFARVVTAGADARRRAA